MHLRNFIVSVIAILCQVVPASAAKALINKSEDIYLAFNCAKLNMLELPYEPPDNSKMIVLQEIL